jgi:hypothetical protein
MGSSRVFKLISLNSTNLNQIGTLGERVRVTGYHIYNSNASARYVKLFVGNALFGGGGGAGFSGGKDAPTVGTDVPQITLGIPGSSSIQVGLYYPLLPLTGNLFLATTVNAADNDSTAVGAGDIIANIFFE